MAIQYISPVLCFTLNLVLQILSLRFFQRIGLLRSIYLGFFAGLTVLACFWPNIFLRLSPFLSVNLSFAAASMSIYLCLSYSYFHFLNLGETARRIRILRELYDSKEGLSYGELLERYNANMIIEVRLKRLIDSGQIELKNGRYFIRVHLVLFFSHWIMRMKKIIYGKGYEAFV